jgi:hypothetical protein
VVLAAAAQAGQADLAVAQEDQALAIAVADLAAEDNLKRDKNQDR